MNIFHVPDNKPAKLNLKVGKITNGSRRDSNPDWIESELNSNLGISHYYLFFRWLLKYVDIEVSERAY